jgi:anti-sigma regulatory factor (Ser/Thr protein kinase)
VETLLTLDAVRILAGRPQTARAARIWVVSHLPDSPAADDVALMVSELVTHAILCSRSGLPGGSVTVRLAIRADQLRVDVIDQGNGREQPALPARPPGLPSGGHAGGVPHIDKALVGMSGLGVGLVIVRELADAFGAEGPDKWFTLSLGGAR